VSTENYLEGYVVFDLEDQWFVQSRLNMNRAINGDVVVAQLLPESEWTCPEKMIRLRDAEEGLFTAIIFYLLYSLHFLEMKISEVSADDDESAVNENEEELLASSAKKPKKEAVPTARVVGILRRNWRNYCGIIIPPNLPGFVKSIY
jgi:exosome complex exonuclease DIS3/RRP44